MTVVSPRVARALCEKYDEVVRMTVAKMAKRSRKSQILDADDLLQIGRIALVEALLTFRDDRGMLFRSWASHVVLWRCKEALQAAVDPFDGLAMQGDLKRAHARGEIADERYVRAMEIA